MTNKPNIEVPNHTDKIDGLNIYKRALKWSLSHDTGVSSKTICAFMTGNIDVISWHSAPSDAADRGRCIRLLIAIPEWLSRLDELKTLDTGTVSTNGAPAIPRRQTEYSWTHQIPLIKSELENRGHNV